MVRLPTPGGDAGSWGSILNDYLSQVHENDGQLKDGVVTQSKLSATGASTGQVLSTDGTNLTWATVSGFGSVPDATTTTRGLVQLAGDLGGTAAAPTVPGLSGKANQTITVAGQGSLSGGGDLSTNRTLSLVNDNATPGASRYYGTDSAGAKGYFALPNSDLLEFNVKDFGAVGDGSTDDTTAFQDALATAKSSTLAGVAATVWVPGGNYLTGSLQLANRVTLRGFGPGSSRLLLKTDATAPLVGIETHARACSVFDLTLDGGRTRGATSTAAHGLYFNNAAAQDSDTGDGTAEYVDSRHFAANLIIQNCAGSGFKQTGRGVVMASNIQCWYNAGHGFDTDVDSFYVNCDAGASGLDGFIVRYGSNRFTGCKAWYSGQVSTSGGETDGTGYGFHITNGNFTANTFASCGAQDNARAGFYMNNVGRQTFSACEADSNNTAGLGHAGIECIGSYHNRFEGFSWDRAANTNHQVAAVRVMSGLNNTIAISCDGISNMAEGRLANNSYTYGHHIQIDADKATTGASYAASFTPDPFLGGTQFIELTGNMTVNAPTESYYGQTLTFMLQQDSTGGRTVTFASSYHTAWTPDTTANKVNTISFVCVGSEWIQTATATNI